MADLLLRARRHSTPALMLFPAFLIMAAVVGYPLIGAVVLSFQRLRMNAPREFVGIANYRFLLDDPEMWRSLGVTATFVSVSLLLTVSLGLALAVLLYQDFRGQRWLRALVLVPWALAPVVNGIMWKSLYSPGFGPLNDVLSRIGIVERSINWLVEYPLPCLVLAYMWKVMPFPTLILLAGLEGIPVELYEAAQVDGAPSLRRFWHITLPMLRTIMFLAGILVLVDALKVFALVDILTRGGPAGQTTVLNYAIFRTAFRFFDFGYGAAMSFALTAIILALVMFHLRLSRVQSAEAPA